MKLIVGGFVFLLLFSVLTIGFDGNTSIRNVIGVYEGRTLANTSWPMFKHDLNHTGLSPYNTSGNNGTLKWKFLTGGSVYSSPAIGVNGTIYVGSDDCYLYAINPDGTLKWKFQTGDTHHLRR